MLEKEKEAKRKYGENRYRNMKENEKTSWKSIINSIKQQKKQKNKKTKKKNNFFP